MARRGDAKRLLLRELSANSRMSVTELARRVGCSRNTVIAKMGELEREAGLWCTVELDRRELGFVQSHIWRIKFGRKPDFGYIDSILGKEENVQMVARTEGDFDLLVKIVASTGLSYLETGRRMLRNLAKYGPTVNSSTVVKKRFGLVKLDDEITGGVDFSRFGMDPLDRDIIMMLNENARMPSKEMARWLGAEEATVRYRLSRIMKSGLIKRFTVAAKVPKEGYLAAFFMSRSFGPGSAAMDRRAEKRYIELEDAGGHLNALQYLTLTIPNDTVFGIAHFKGEESAIRGISTSHRRIFRNDSPKLSMARIKEVTKGTFAFRNLNLGAELAKTGSRWGTRRWQGAT